MIKHSPEFQDLVTSSLWHRVSGFANIFLAWVLRPHYWASRHHLLCSCPRFTASAGGEQFSQQQKIFCKHRGRKIPPINQDGDCGGQRLGSNTTSTLLWFSKHCENRDKINMDHEILYEATGEHGNSEIHFGRTRVHI